MDYENSMTIGSGPYDNENEDYQKVTLSDIAEALEIKFPDVQRGFKKATLHFGLTEIYVFAKYHYVAKEMTFKVDAISVSENGLKYSDDERLELAMLIEDELIEAYEKECRKNPTINFWKHIHEISKL